MRGQATFILQRLLVLSLNLGLGLAFAIAPGSARADHSHHDTHHGEQIVAVKALGGLFVSREHSGWIGGAALVYERELIAHRFAVEASAGVLFESEGQLFPIELLLKFPFHFGEAVEIFVGGGPSLTIHSSHGDVSVGAVLALGAFYWLGHHVGLLAEVDNTICAHDGAVDEIALDLGVAYRF